MKWSIFACKSAVLAALLTLSIGAPTPVLAQQQPTPIVVGVVDVDQIMRDSKVGKSIRSQFDQQKKAFEDEVAKQRKAYADAKQKLLDQKDKLPDDQLRKKAEELNKQADETEKKLGQRQRNLEVSANKAQNQALKTMAQIVQEMAKARGISLVVTKAATVVYDSSYEITGEVLKKLDAKLPTIKLQ